MGIVCSEILQQVITLDLSKHSSANNVEVRTVKPVSTLKCCLAREKSRISVMWLILPQTLQHIPRVLVTVIGELKSAMTAHILWVVRGFDTT